MYYNDGVKSNTFFGLDNTNSSTRFGFSGSAKITPTVTAGFTIVIDVADTGRTAAANQANEDGGSARGVNCTANAPTTAAGVLGPAGTIPAVNCRNNTNGDHFLRMRNAFWYLELSSRRSHPGRPHGNVRLDRRARPRLASRSSLLARKAASERASASATATAQLARSLVRPGPSAATP